jgi:hypothetical protein
MAEHDDGLVIVPATDTPWGYWCPHCGRDVSHAYPTMAEADAGSARHGLVCPGIYEQREAWARGEEV